MECRHLWRPQPFRELRPDWCALHPRLTSELLALDERAVVSLNSDEAAAHRFLCRHFPAWRRPGLPGDVLPAPVPRSLVDTRWSWGVPGRKGAQIEAFVAACAPAGLPVLEWCAGKGHLGRLLALRHGVPVLSLDSAVDLCCEGQKLAVRAGVNQAFLAADALTFKVPAGRHVVALHACGELHRALLRQANDCAALDIAPCCYHLGMEDVYSPLSSRTELILTSDEVRLAVTETVTASPRQARQRDRALAWKLAFDAWRRQVCASGYVAFKPIPSIWWQQDFRSFCQQLSRREGVDVPGEADYARLEARGWQRQREVMRLSIVRHAFRRSLEWWLVLDMAVSLQERGWQVGVAPFCPRAWTPRNLLVSARRREQAG